MHDAVITVENLAKKYVIRHEQRERYTALRDVLARKLTAPFRALRTAFSSERRRAAGVNSTEDFWALKDISFEIKAGETVGIIGRNGAGKSTLLKVLSRITEPTRGRVKLRGRIASLLEVGTGFHQELSGRENIFLNGSILGMTREEIRRKFDEIVAFAEIEKFLDTPVKRYSSGMYVRLAFAVAAHLEPEVLIVDEVLAVGDAGFQKKCLEKMESVGSHGRTVLFVSHNMQSVTRLCRRAILLEEGSLKKDGPAHEVASAYMNPEAGSLGAREWPNAAVAPGNDVTRLRAVRIKSIDGQIIDSTDIRQPVAIEMEYDVLKPGHVFHNHFHVGNEAGVMAFIGNDTDPEWQGRKRPAGRYVTTGWIPGNYLAEGLVYINAVLLTLNPENLCALEQNAVAFHVLDDLSAKDTARGEYPRPVPGIVRPKLQWTTRFTPFQEKPSKDLVITHA